jgi:hypothetical protein
MAYIQRIKIVKIKNYFFNVIIYFVDTKELNLKSAK